MDPQGYDLYTEYSVLFWELFLNPHTSPIIEQTSWKITPMIKENRGQILDNL